MEIKLQLINDYEIKDKIDPNYIKGGLIRRGYGNVYELYHGAHSATAGYVLKTLPANTYLYGDKCYSDRDIAMNEIYITKTMSDLGIAPLVYDIALDDSKGYIVMEKYDGTLQDLIYLYQTDKSIKLDEIIVILKSYIEKMHEHGIVHRDLSSNNIMYKTDGSIAIIDYGFSIYSKNEKLRSYDYDVINELIEIKKKIDNNEKFELKKIHLGGLVENFTFLYNGNICDDWS